VSTYRTPAHVPRPPLQASELLSAPAFSHGEDFPRAACFFGSDQVASVDGRMVNLFDAASGRRLAQNYLASAADVAPTVEGGSLLVAAGASIAVFARGDHRVQRTVKLDLIAHRLRCSPCGRWVAILCGYGESWIEIWTADVSKKLGVIQCRVSSPFVFAPDGEHLFVASSDPMQPAEEVALHAVPSGRRLAVAQTGRCGPERENVSVGVTAVARVGERIILSSGPYQRNLYEARVRRTWWGRRTVELSLVREGSGTARITDLAGCDGGLVAVRVARRVEIFDITAPSDATAVEPSDEPFDWSPDGTRLVARLDHRLSMIGLG
jgi:hypothetical protein